ncbi:DegV family protein [Oscillospiraceae bacterium 42-9]
MSVRIITDSAADLPVPHPQAVTVLPMTVSFEDRHYQDGVDLTHRQFYERLIESDALPITSQVSPGQFAEAFHAAVEAGEDVVAVTLSGKLSGTYQSACLAAQDYPDRVWVVDSENATIGQLILVERALELLNQGLGAGAIAARLDQEKKSVRLIALLDTLEYLKRGGRISPATALVGGLLAVKPVVAVRQGEVVVLGKARGSKNGNSLLVQEIEKTAGVDFTRPYRLGYTGLSDALLQKYVADSRQLWQDHTESLPICTVGGTIGTHVGPGAVAVAFFCR